MTSSKVPALFFTLALASCAQVGAVVTSPASKSNCLTGARWPSRRPAAYSSAGACWRPTPTAWRSTSTAAEPSSIALRSPSSTTPTPPAPRRARTRCARSSTAPSKAASAPAPPVCAVQDGACAAPGRRHHARRRGLHLRGQRRHVGDLDGDGAYEIILKWEPTNAKDNSQSGYTGKRLRRRVQARRHAAVAHRPGPQHPRRRALHAVPGLRLRRRRQGRGRHEDGRRHASTAPAR